MSPRHEQINPPIYEMAIVMIALTELENGDHATAGRDFGRGIKFACDLIRQRLANGDLGGIQEAEVKLISADEINA